MGEHIVPDDGAAPAVHVAQPAPDSGAEERHLGRDATPSGDVGDVAGGLHPEHPHSAVRKQVRRLPSLLATSTTRSSGASPSSLVTVAA